MELKEILKEHLNQASDILNDFINNDEYLSSVEEAAQTIITALQNGNKIISAGNGGSMCDAMHFAEELSGRWRDDRKPLAAISVSDPSHITCVGNDYGFDRIFSRYIEAIGNTGDVFFGITTSGNSGNICRATISAKNKGLKVVILTSDRPESDIRSLFRDSVDNIILTPQNKYADRTQELHIKIIHSLIDMIERKLGLKNNN
jgi:D-sedoheptulose 7-phosphate isomerase